MQIQNNQLSFQGAKANAIRQKLINQGKSLKAGQIPGADRWIATLVPVEAGKAMPVTKQYLEKASSFPYLIFMSGKSETQAMFKRIRKIMQMTNIKLK